jgi:hypothetical protein
LTIPPLDSFSASLPRLKQKKAELHVDISNLKSQCAIIRARMQDSPRAGNEHEIRVREILGETPVAVSLPDPDQLWKLQRDLEVLNTAVSTIDTAILHETRVANTKLCESVKPEITKLGNAFARAFADLHARHLEFDQYIDDLEDAGASVGQFRLRPNGLSHPRDLSGSYFYSLREFIDAGFFSQRDMPKALK